MNGETKSWRNKITLLKNTVKPTRSKKTLKDSTVIKYLEELQEKYVMTPIDKADSNIAFICKRHYVQVIVKELGLADTPTSTYEPIFNTDTINIIKQDAENMH